MQDKDKTLKWAINIIADNLGDYTANLYKDFYKDKDSNTIISSVSELMNEVMGKENSEELIKNI